MKVINVRPKTPDQIIKIEVVPQAPAGNIGPFVPLKTDKEQMVPKHSEMLPLNKDDGKGDLLKYSSKFAEETTSVSFK